MLAALAAVAAPGPYRLRYSAASVFRLADSRSDKIGSLAEGEPFVVLGTQALRGDVGDFYPVMLPDGSAGFVYAHNLVVAAPDCASAPSAAGAPSVVPAAREGAVASRQRPLWLVAALSFATFGLYWFWWFGATWSEMKRELRDDTMHPFGHVLALFVPIYWLFRVHAHYRTIKELLESVGATVALRPGQMVLVLMAASFMGNLTWRTHGPAAFLAVLIADGLLAWAIVQGQRLLNSYWEAASGGSAEGGVRAGEWVVLALGAAIALILYLGLLAS
jgi:hypothetical protein